MSQPNRIELLGQDNASKLLQDHVQKSRKKHLLIYSIITPKQ